MSRILVVDREPPQATRDGASARLTRMLGVLRGLGHDVAFAADLPWPEDLPDARLRALGIEVVARDGDVAGWLCDHGRMLDAVIVSRVQVAERLVPAVRSHAPRARLVFDTMDLHHVQLYRLAKLRRDAGLVRRALATKTAELRVARAADAVLAVSADEAAVLRRELPGAAVHVVSDALEPAPPGPGFGERHGALFVGYFGHPPNADAARLLVEEVWPLVRAAEPSIGLTLVGALAPDDLARPDRPWLDVAGYVPDLDPVLDGARVFVAPLLSGAGVKIKVLTAMAHGLPVVATPVALEGIPADDRVHALTGDDPATIAGAVVAAHCDRALWTRLAGGGRRLVDERFSPARAGAALAAALGGAREEAIGA